MKKTKLLIALAAAGMLVACGSTGASSVAPSTSKAPASTSKTTSTSKGTSVTSTSKAPEGWVAGTKTGVVTPETKGEEKAYRLDVADAQGWNKPTTKMNAKSGADSMSTWDITGKIPAGKYAVEMEALMTYASHSDRYFYNQYVSDTASQPDTEDQDPYRYFFKVNGVGAINPRTDVTWGDLGLEGENNGGSPKFVKVVESFELQGDAKSFSLKHGNIGYSLIISSVRLIKVGDITGAPFKASFDVPEGVSIEVYAMSDLLDKIPAATQYVTRNGDNGMPSNDPEAAQINFKVVMSDPELKIKAVTATEGAYKNIKTPADNKTDGYKVTKINKDIVIKVEVTKELKGFNVTINADEHAHVTVYKDQTYTIEDTDAQLQTRNGKDAANGYPYCNDGNDSQVNFKVTVDAGYEIASVTATAGAYKNIKDPEELMIEGAYRITKVSGDIVITVTTQLIG